MYCRLCGYAGHFILGCFSNHKPTAAYFFSLSLAIVSARTLHQQFESYKEQVRKIGAETKRQQAVHKDDAPTCGICRKTKFADGCGHLCSYCQTKFCARCGGRVSLRSNNVSTCRQTLSLLFLPHPPHHLSHHRIIPMSNFICFITLTKDYSFFFSNYTSVVWLIPF